MRYNPIVTFSNTLVFSAFDAAAYFLFNNPLVGIAITTLLSVWEVRIRFPCRLNRTQTVSSKNHHRCDVSSCCVAQVLNLADEPRHSLHASTYYPEYKKDSI